MSDRLVVSDFCFKCGRPKFWVGDIPEGTGAKLYCTCDENTLQNIISIKQWKYCPYCGKELK
jgi:hypothetical protein